MGQILSEVEEGPKREPFFRRQFQPARTQRQLVFDFIFGVVLPLLCLAIDPVVFRSGVLSREAILGQYQVFAYLISAIEIFALLVWLCFERQAHDYGAIFGGIFLVGAAFSTVVGIAILPYSLLGLLFVIGVAGFTPFMTSFVYLRNAYKAFRSARNAKTQRKPVVGAVAGLIALGLPVIVSHQISTTISLAVDEILKGDARQAQTAVERLQWLPFLPQTSLDRLVSAYEREQDAKKKEALKKYYKDATGRDIDHRHLLFND